MLVIRMQRTGRTGHAQFRVIAQDKRYSPTSGRVVSFLGSYDPHTKEAKLDKEKIGQLLANGAQPSGRVAGLLKKEGIKLPAWVKQAGKKKGAVKNPDKRRSTRPAGEPAPKPAPVKTDEPPEATAADEPKPAETTVAETTADSSVVEDTPAAEKTAEAEETAIEAPVEEPPAEDSNSEAGPDNQETKT